MQGARGRGGRGEAGQGAAGERAVVVILPRQEQWDGVGVAAGTVAPMQRYVVSKEQQLRSKGDEGHYDADIESVEDVDDWYHISDFGAEKKAGFSIFIRFFVV